MKYYKAGDVDLVCIKNFANGDVLSAIRNLPTIDIVRCGECKWFDSKGHCMRLTAEYGTYEDVRTDDFCAYGERKEKTE